ncbi:GNAT family N-acetyltransferase [Kitasatospora sp. YST-16]|uniref:GNAT family N-acetyltransferase n=1 Tax=Kitasatospora sp. YST-16 TaxID=2998080 RepID=UPI00228469FF|nr:GNAT family N-acetyltransferase [Kitasatospora sp. YST-16]WAL74561.1 GNAT family N-acetyltransferase [Kitasatospora sp. YST-16]WNW40619.1 GNAT family N-acetyltransferase [Streptomyces sp. Li-HN-5-13]
MTPPGLARPVAAVLSAVPYDHPEARRLTNALHAEQTAMYGFADDPAATEPELFAPPNGLFLLARPDGHDEALACGGWHLVAPATVEIKRMYVAPAARGLALGSRVLRALERQAYEHGARRAILETGSRNLAALALYEHLGYRPIPPYAPGRNPLVNRAMAKQLTAA